MTGWPFTIVSFVYLDTALLAAAVGIFAWRRRSVPGARPLAGLLFAAALWAAAEAAENMAPTLDMKILCSKISHVGIQAVPVFFLLFSLYYTRRVPWRSNRSMLWLWLMPALAVIAAATNDWHGLFWRDVQIIDSPLGTESVYRHGPLFWATTAYLYVLILAATVLLVQTVITYRDAYRRQAAIVLAAAAVPWLANVVYLSGANPLPGFDWTPLAFTITGVLLAWAMYRFGLLELAPVARTALFEHITDALLVTDAESRVVDANPAAYAFFAGHGALIGRPLGDLLPAAVMQRLAAGAEEEFVVAVENGATRQFDVRTTALNGEQFAPTGRLIALRDTTERLRLEETLRHSERRYRTLVDNAPFPSVVASIVDGTLLYANRRALDLFAINEDDIQHYSLTDLFVDPDASSRLIDRFRMEGAVADQEVQLNAGDGRTLWALLSAVPVTLANDEAVFASVNDITARRQAEQALVSAKNAAESASRAKDEFLAVMSHELRTPLNSILGLSEALLEEVYGPLTTRQQRSLQLIASSGGRLTEVVNDVLDLSRLEAGAIELNIAEISADEVCRSALRILKSAVPADTPPPVYTIDPADLLVEVDAYRLRQVIFNLLNNAVKFSPRGGPVGLDVAANAADNRIEFTVWDQGIGIDAERQRRLFLPFTQGDTGRARQYEGMGLGLAIVRHLVTLHGGAVTLQSEPGKGSRFTVHLPWRRAARSTPTTGARYGNGKGNGAPTS